MSWSVDCLARAFRECYAGLNWFKVFESLANIKESDIQLEKHGVFLDQKGLVMLTGLYSKCKPQNLPFPL
jgi:hypothetical protein